MALKGRAQLEVEDEVAALRKQLGATRFAAGWAEGQALSLAEAVALATSERVAAHPGMGSG